MPFRGSIQGALSFEDESKVQATDWRANRRYSSTCTVFAGLSVHHCHAQAPSWPLSHPSLRQKWCGERRGVFKKSGSPARYSMHNANANAQCQPQWGLAPQTQRPLLPSLLFLSSPVRGAGPLCSYLPWQSHQGNLLNDPTLRYVLPAVGRQQSLLVVLHMFSASS